MQIPRFRCISPSPQNRLRAAALCLLLLCPLAISGAEDSKAKLGKAPKDSLARNEIRTLDGQRYSLSELRGKVVVLDYFAIWCGHSRRHIPTMTRFGEAEKAQGLQILGLAVKDAESTPDRIRKFMEELKITYPVGTISDPEFSEYINSRDVSVPQTLVYARDGRLVAHFSGHNDATAAELTETIKRELSK
ncbi:MAG: TlpA disulfide reductase family protein [Blastocatellia bacterium]|nr:TlpA disulfide reductase family protein [Blastocatellia bacterium]